MKQRSTSTFWARLYLSGPIEVAKQTLRKDCLRAGLCVTITPTTFIYTGGEETGYVVELVNYPRFPSSPAAITERAYHLLQQLMADTFQHSALLMTPEETQWITLRVEVTDAP